MMGNICIIRRRKGDGGRARERERERERGGRGESEGRREKESVSYSLIFPVPSLFISSIALCLIHSILFKNKGFRETLLRK